MADIALAKTAASHQKIQGRNGNVPAFLRSFQLEKQKSGKGIVFLGEILLIENRYRKYETYFISDRGIGRADF